MESGGGQNKKPRAQMGVGHSDADCRCPERKVAPDELNDVAAPGKECSGIVRLKAHGCSRHLWRLPTVQHHLYWSGQPVKFRLCGLFRFAHQALYKALQKYCQARAHLHPLTQPQAFKNAARYICTALYGPCGAPLGFHAFRLWGLAVALARSSLVWFMSLCADARTSHSPPPGYGN